mgnify:CR=1 FL=1
MTERVRGTAARGRADRRVLVRDRRGGSASSSPRSMRVAGAPSPSAKGAPACTSTACSRDQGFGHRRDGDAHRRPLTTGAEVELLPSGTGQRVRGLQTHHRDVGSASPVSRVAANLTAERARIARARSSPRPACGPPRPSSRRASNRSDRSTVRSRRAARSSCTRRAAERDARIRPYDVKQVPAERGLRQDHAVGAARPRRGRPVRPARVGTAANDAPAGSSSTPRRRAARRPGADATSRGEGACIARRAPGPLGRRTPGGAGSTTSGRSWVSRPMTWTARYWLGGWWVDRRDVRRGRRGGRGTAGGVPRRGTRRGRAGRRDGPAIGRGRVRRIGGAARSRARRRRDRPARDRGCARPGGRRGSARVASSRRRRRVAALVDVVRSAEPTPPTIAELRASGSPPVSWTRPLRSGAIVRISPELVADPRARRTRGAIVREAGSDGITVSALRERLGTSRKYAVPLAEHLDRAGVTRRSGDLRFARGAATGADESPAQPS